MWSHRAGLLNNIQDLKIWGSRDEGRKGNLHIRGHGDSSQPAHTYTHTRTRSYSLLLRYEACVCSADVLWQKESLESLLLRINQVPRLLWEALVLNIHTLFWVPSAPRLLLSQPQDVGTLGAEIKHPWKDCAYGLIRSMWSWICFWCPSIWWLADREHSRIYTNQNQTRFSWAWIPKDWWELC